MGAVGANHNPRVVVNGEPGKAPLTIVTEVGTPVTIDAAGTTDPDGHALAYRWFFYPEAGSGVPGQPVFAGRAEAGVPSAGAGGMPSAGDGGPPQPAPRLTLERADTASAVAALRVPGIAHVILAVEDRGTPALTSYRRVILRSPEGAR